MGYEALYIFIEGPDDQRFFEKIILPLIKDKYTHIEFYPYAQEKPEKVCSFLKSIKSMREKKIADYYLISDMDNNPCISSTKEYVKHRFSTCEVNKIIVVIKEIECWYLAGAEDTFLKKHRIISYGDTCNLKKEDFCKIMPQNFSSRTDFMIEILKYFSLEKAKDNNKSFNYIMNIISS